MNFQAMRGEALSHPRWHTLERRLLSIGGNRVVPMPEPDIDHLLEVGVVMRLRKRVFRRGEPHACHYNAAINWLKNPKAIIYTGWVLSGGVWRQHSWNRLENRILDYNGVDAYTSFGAPPKDPFRFLLSNAMESLCPEDFRQRIQSLSEAAIARFEKGVKVFLSTASAVSADGRQPPQGNRLDAGRVLV
jgi:hypothetical protein